MDNSKEGNSFFTPILREELSKWGKVVSCTTKKEIVKVIGEQWDAVVLSGSSLNLSQPLCISAVSKDLMVLLQLSNVPILGVCFGMQLMALAYGGHVKRMDKFVSETRETKCDKIKNSILSGRFNACFSHGDAVTEVPPLFEAVAMNGDYIDAMESVRLLRFGVQFHPERSPSSPTIQNFMLFAHRHKAMHNIPLYETLSTGEILPWSAVRHMEHMIGRINIHHLANIYSVSKETVLQVWKDFRERFRIPAILL